MILRTGTVKRVWLVEPDGSGSRSLAPATIEGLDMRFRWSPDGRSMVIMGAVLKEDPVTRISRHVAAIWSVDVASGETTQVQTPVGSWQRLGP